MTTLKQFEDSAKIRCLNEDQSLNSSEYDKCYPAGSRAEEWRKELDQLAKSGLNFGPDALALYSKNFPNSVPKNVLFSTGKLA